MITTSGEYKEFLEGLRLRLMAVNSTLPSKGRRKVMLQAAAELDYSFMTISNYLSGRGYDPYTSLLIIEKIEQINGGEV